MRKLLFLSILFLMGISANAQRYDIITQDICWNTGSVDSSLTRYFLVSPLASTVKVLAHLNSAGQKVVPSGGTFSAGHCGCCGGTTTSTTSTNTPARSGLFNDGDTIKLGGQVRENTSLGGMGQYGLDATNWKYLNFSASDSFKIITPGLIDAAIDVGGLLQVNSLTGRVEFTPYAFPLTAGTDGQFQQYNSATNQMEWRSPYVTAVETDTSYRFSVNGSSVSALIKQELIVDSISQVVGKFLPNGFSIISKGIDGKGESRHIVQSDSIANFVNDSLAAISLPSGNYAVLYIPDKGINATTFGAKDVANYFSRKNPIPPSAPTNLDYSDPYFDKAIKYLNAQQDNLKKTNPTRLLIKGQYYIDTLTLAPSNGVELWCEGNSYLHKNGRDTAVLIKDHYGMKHRINVSYRTWDGTTTRDWYPKNSEILPEDSTSVGIQITNSRNNIIEASALKFMDGFRMQGDGDGVVNNTIYPGDISNNRFNVIDRNINGGWANQNTFIGGKINGVGLPNRNYAVDINCAYVWLNSADNTTFIGVNMEGSTNYKYAIYNDGAANQFNNVRLEGVKANQLFFDSNQRSNVLIAGYEGFVLNGLFEFGVYYSTDGTTATLPKNPDGTNAKSSMFLDIKESPIYLAAGSAKLPGADNVGAGFENVTLQLETKNQTSASTLLRIDRDEKIGFEALGNGEYNYYGPNGYSKEAYFTRRGEYDTVTFATDNWISKDKLVLDGGNTYWARTGFKVSGTIAEEITNNNLVLDSGEEIPVVKFRDNGLDVEELGGVENLSGVTAPPKFIDSYTLELEPAITTSNTTYSLPVSEKAIARVNHSISDGVCTISFDMTDIPTGTVFALTNGIDNGSVLKIVAGGTVKSSTGESEILISYRQIVYFQYAYNIIQEVYRSSNGIRSVGTTAQRPALLSEYTDFLYFDTDLNHYIRWNGVAWNTGIDQAYIEGITNPQGGTNTIQAALDSLNAHITALEAAAPTSTVEGTTPTATSGTSLVITHNLGSFPSAINITPAGDIGNWHLSGINTTTMTLNYETVTPSSVTIYWQVE